MIFSRKRGSAGRHSQNAGGGGRHERTTDAATQNADEFTDEELDVDESGRANFGPYDVSEAPKDTKGRLDLGALHIPTVAGVDIQLEAASSGEIQRVQLAYGGSRLQLGAFAAPRTEGIWDEIRAELRAALVGGGAKLAEVDGEYGPELQARLGGGQDAVEVRHIGIDGPRWFVHGVYVGAAAVDPDQAGPLREALRGLVVDRGADARPVKEPLPLRLPAEAAAQLAEMVSDEQAAADPAKPEPTSGADGATQASPDPASSGSAAAAQSGSAPAGPSGTSPRSGGTARRRTNRGGKSARAVNEGT